MNPNTQSAINYIDSALERVSREYPIGQHAWGVEYDEKEAEWQWDGDTVCAIGAVTLLEQPRWEDNGPADACRRIFYQFEIDPDGISDGWDGSDMDTYAGERLSYLRGYGIGRLLARRWADRMQDA